MYVAKADAPDVPIEFLELPLAHLKGEKKLWFVTIPWYRLLEDIYFVDHKGRGYLIEAGYEFNGLSVPWIFWSICPPGQPEALTASLLHDFLYQYKIVPRAYADLVFYYFMVLGGYYEFGCRRNWLAVRTFGWLVY